MTDKFQLAAGHPVARLQWRALAIGIGSMGLALAGTIVAPQQFFRSYLVAYLFWFGIALGSLAILMIYHITGGAWGAVIRRVLESATRTMPLLALLFIPLLFGLPDLYEWARPEEVAHDPILQHKSAYLNVPFFLARAAFYFLVWCIFAWFLSRWSQAQDETGDPAWVRRLENLSRGGLAALGITVTFASIDWAMSLEPHWYSTIYGILIAGGQILAAMAFVIPVAALLADDGPLSGVISAEQFHDLGKLMLAFVMLWAYFSFSQYLIIWSGNLTEEIPWYLRRLQGGWQWVGLALVVFHFAIPFVILLSRSLKRNARRLALVAMALVVMRFVDTFWLITPAFSPAAFSVHWMDLATVVGLGGIWLSAFVWQLKGRPLVPLNDPSLPEQVHA
jgi:hypothetical protein